MPITTKCPHCEKPYKLKDELAGKKVACGNPNCRQSFTVPADTNGFAPAMPAPPPPAKKPPPTSNPDAEALAAAALAEEPDNVPQDTRVIAMTCAMCDHKWDVPFAMQGKNVLCPDCRHRQKVPEQKKRKTSDWRDGTGGPSMAKQEELEGVQGTVKTTRVSGSALRDAGVVKIEYEPRPLWQYFAVVLVPLLVIGSGIYGVMSWRADVKEVGQERTLDEAVKKIREITETPYPSTEQPLFRAVLYTAAGEHTIRHAKEKKDVDEAIAFWSNARGELETAAPSRSRDLLIIELGLAWLHAGGTTEQIAEQNRILWEPLPPGKTRIQLNEKAYNVQNEVGKVFSMLNQATPLEMQLDGLRRLARIATALGHPEIVDAIVNRTTADADKPRAKAEVLAEIYRAKRDTDVATALANIGQTGPSYPPPADAVAQTLPTPPKGVTLRKAPSATGDVSKESRETFVTLHLLKGEDDQALEVAKRTGGSLEDRLRSLALLAEWSDKARSDAITTATDLIASDIATRERDKKGTTLGESPQLFRLARQIGRLGALEKLDVLLKLTKDQKDESTRSWLKAIALEESLRTRPGPAEDALFELPNDPKDYRSGHAWGKMAMARHNVKVNMPGLDPTYSGWHATLQPFGLAGNALGKQDVQK